MKNKEIKIITFTPRDKRCYPSSTVVESWMDEKYIPHTEIDIVVLTKKQQ